MRFLRSLYLSPVPIVARAGAGWRRASRAIWTAVVAGLLLLTYLVIDQQTFSANSPAYILYWLHDNIYLQAVAYTFTLPFPNSLVWWIIIALLVGLWLFSFLSDSSLILGAHTRWLRSEVGKLSAREWLFRWARRFHSLGIQPHLLQALVEHERTLCLGVVAAAPLGQAGPRAYVDLATLTALSVKLHLLSSKRGSRKGATISATHLQGANQWLTAVLWLRLHNQFQNQNNTPAQGQQKPPDATLQLATSSMATLTNLAQALVRPVASTPSQWRRAASFDAATLLVDLAYVAALLDGTNMTPIITQNFTQITNAQITNPAPQNAQSPISPPKPEVHLGRAVEARLALLNSLRKRLEVAAWGQLTLERHLLRSHNTLPELPDEHAALIGQLSVGLALEAAIATRRPELALTYLDTLDALALAAAVVGETDSRTIDNRSGGEPPQRELLRQLEALLTAIPTATDYHIATMLMGNKNRQRTREWQNAKMPLKRTSIGVRAKRGARRTIALVSQDDFALANHRLDELHHAAGPHFAPADDSTQERA